MANGSVHEEADKARRTAILFTLAAMVLTITFSVVFARLMMAPDSSMRATSRVVVAAVEIPAFSRLAAHSLKAVPWPAISVPEGSYASVEDALKVPQVTLRALLPGEPVVAKRLGSAEGGAGAALLVEPQKRAFVVRVNESLAVSKLLYPGVYVDVVATLPEKYGTEAIAKVVLQNIQVLAVGPTFDSSLDQQPDTDSRARDGARADIERQRVVTLMVSPEEVEYLAFITRDGTVDLALRNAGDSALVATEGVTRRALFEGAEEGATSAGSPTSRVKRKGKTTGPAIYRVGQ